MDHEEFLSNLNDNLTNKPLEEIKNEGFSSEVASGKVKFLTVVESIQGVLTNENISVREKGIEFLSWLLSKLPKELFNSSEISVLVNFYCDCLKGHHNFIPPAIRGLLKLIQMKALNKEDLVKILVTLFQNVNCQSQLHADRMVLYEILKFVIENFLEDLKQMGPDFVFGVISIIEGESDPFCLNIIFNCLPLFIKNFDLGHLSEEMFEVLSCYFPLDFNPSSKESVTREDLSDALHRCLSASDSFSEQSIALILEKADSTLKTAKLDCYKLLQECCKTLRVDSLEKHINPLWKILSKDVLPGNEKQICDSGLCALADIFHLLSQDVSQHNILNTFIDDILITIRSLTNRVDENMFQPAIRVLLAASSKSAPACNQILPHLKSLSQLESNKTPMETKIILYSLLPFLKIFLKYKIMESQIPEEMSCYSEIVSFYLNAGASADFEIRKLGFSGILEVLPASTVEFRRKLFEIILENIKTKDDIRMSDEFVNVWRNLAEHAESELYDFVTKNFSVSENEKHFSNYLWALSFIADHSKFTGYVIPTFINVIDGRQKCITALESLLNTCRFSKTNGANFFRVIHSEHNIINRLIVWYLEFNPRAELAAERTLHLVSEIIALVTRNQNSERQQGIVDNVTEMFFREAIPLNGCGDFAPGMKSPADFPPGFVLIFEAVLGSVRQDIKIPIIWILRERLTNLALNSEDEFVRLSSSRLLATFVNKSEDSVMFDLLSGISKDIFAHIENDGDLRVKLNSSFLFTWVVKGVILRGGETSEDWISTWFSLLGRKDIGEAIAEGFRIVIEEDDLYLNLDSHCIVRVLYRQRLFGNLSKLVTMYETSDSVVKMNYMLAMVRLLQGVPIHLIKMEISSIITILVRCLDADKPEVLLTSLEILAVLLDSKENILTDYTQSFLPKFLKLARLENYMKIRINALRCLYFYGFYPTINLLPFKNQVIQELEGCLDDKKRLARREAVKARCRWFLVGAPGSPCQFAAGPSDEAVVEAVREIITCGRFIEDVRNDRNVSTIRNCSLLWKDFNSSLILLSLLLVERTE